MAHLLQYNFRHADSGAIVSREQFMMILINLQALHIRASYFSLVDEVRSGGIFLCFVACLFFCFLSL